MPQLPNSLRAWRTDTFAQALKREIECLGARALPLDKGTAQGGFVDDAEIAAIVLSSTDDAHAIVAHVGVFFTEIVAGCSCGDEPDAINTYCRLQVRIDKTTAQAVIHVISDQGERA